MGLNYNPASVTQGLVYYLDLTNSRCYSGSGNTLTNLANGAIGITIVSGITYDTDYRKNLNFNGSSGYMTGNDTNLDFSTSDFTIQTTLKLNGLSNGFTGSYGSMICAGTALTNNSSIFRFSGTATSHYALALWHQPTSTAIERNFNFQINKIYNLAVTKRFNVVEFFVDGTSIGTTTSSNNFNFTANGFAIGRWFYPGSEQYLKGSIFDFRAYNRALSIDEIQQNYFSQTKRYYNEENIVTNGLVLNIDPSKSTSYSGVGNTIFDLSGFGNTGALTNGPTFSGLNGGSISFDGSNDLLYSPARSIATEFQHTSAFTIVAWCKITENTGEGYIVNNRTQDVTGTYFTGWGLNHWDGAIWGFVGGYPNNSFSWRRVSTSTTTFNNLVYNKWAHIIFLNTGVPGEQKIYVNGVNATNSASDDTTPPYTINYTGGTHRIYIGYDGSQTHPLTGSISQVKIYNRALSETEISQNFNATRSRFGI